MSEAVAQKDVMAGQHLSDEVGRREYNNKNISEDYTLQLIKGAENSEMVLESFNSHILKRNSENCKVKKIEHRSARGYQACI